jgi:hypothetical protein
MSGRADGPVLVERPGEGVAREFLRSGRDDSIRLRLELSDHVFKSVDCAEGSTAFFEQREQRFEGKV